MAMPENLVKDIKNYLDITWVDDNETGKLSGIIERGIAYINRTAGLAQDFEVNGKPRELLLDYCRYARDGALDLFQQNYLHELLTLQIDVEVAANAALKEPII